MKVKELIAKLGEHDGEVEVLCISEDPELLEIKLFHVDDVSGNEAETSRSDDNKPLMKFGKSELSRPFVFLNVTADF